jgi:eukaryotic-like serine/threonine-protein kinase
MSEELGNVGPYRLLRELGRGATSSVYLAECNGVQVALKWLRAGLDVRSQARERFFREMVLFAILEEVGLGGLINAGIDGDTPYFAYYYRPGETLAKRLQTGTLEAKEAEIILFDIASALTNLHAMGFVHRDVKPDNIIIGPDGHAELVDFGLCCRGAKELALEAVGTFHYAAPEQLGLVHVPVDHRADLYALGATMFFALTGATPAAASTFDQLIRWHLSESSNRILETRSDVPTPLASLISRMLEKDPASRPKNADEVVALLGGVSYAPVRLNPVPGRTSEYDEAKQFLCQPFRAIANKPARTVLVSGGTGSGISYFLRALSDDPEVRTEHVHVISLPKVGAGTAPFTALRRAIDAWLIPLRNDAELVESVKKAAGEFAPLLARVSGALATIFGAVEASRALELTFDATRFPETVADFLVNITTETTRLLIVGDDVDQLDDGTVSVLQAIHTLGGGRVLCLFSTHISDHPVFSKLHGSKAISLAPLHEQSLLELTEYLIGRNRCSPELLDLVASASGGVTSAAVEYIGHLVDAGALLGAEKVNGQNASFRIDRAKANEVAVPKVGVESLLARFKKLSPVALSIAAVCALARSPLALEWIKETFKDQRDVGIDLANAQRQGILAVDSLGNADIAQEVIRAELIAFIPDTERKQLHLKLAEHLSVAKPDELHLIAHHRVNAQPLGSIDVCANAVLVAGKRSLATYANQSAYALLNLGEPLLSETKELDKAEYLELLGQACTRVARIQDASQAFSAALEQNPGPIVKTRIYVNRARLQMVLWNADGVLDECAAALASVRLIVPGNADELSSRFEELRVAGANTSWKPLAVLAGSIYALAGFMAWSSGRLSQFAELAESLARICDLLGLTPETVELHAWHGYFLACDGQDVRAMECIETALKASRTGNDRAVEANVQKLAGWGYHLLGKDEKHQSLAEDSLRRFRKWLSSRDYVAICNDLSIGLIVRGFVRDAQVIAALGLSVADTVGIPGAMANIRASLASTEAILGDAVGAAKRLEEAEAIRAARVPASDFWTGSWVLQHKMIALFEQDDSGPPLDELESAYASLGVPAANWPGMMRGFFLFRAYLRIRRATRTSQSFDIAAARKATEELAATTRSNSLSPVHAYVLEASLHRLNEDQELAEAALAKGRRALQTRYDSFAFFELAREHARQTKEGVDELRELVSREGWGQRERALQREFPWPALSVPPSALGHTSGTARSGSHLTVGLREGMNARVLDAILRIAIASNTTRDPSGVVRSVLDELLDVFGAERAFFFEIKEGAPVFLKGRIPGKRDLGATHGFATTIVNKVMSTVAPVVIAGTEEGAMIGSHSVMSHDLRSIMAAPVMMRDQLQGIIYVDSRVARGLFHEKDLAVLSAMAGHVGVVFDGVRTARIEQAEAELRRDAELTAEVQRFFLPRSEHRQLGRFSIYGTSMSAAQCGGDWWWYGQNQDKLMVFLGDVTGHGSAPAMLTAFMAGLVPSQLRSNGQLDSAMKDLHHELAARCGGDFQVQACAVAIDSDGSFELTSAGATPAILVSKAGLQIITARGTTLGGSICDLGKAEAELQAGARLWLFSDGIVEATNRKGRAFGIKRFVNTVQAAASLPINEAIPYVTNHFDEFRQGCPLADDWSLVAIEQTVRL